MSNEELKEEVDEYLNSVTDCLTEHTFMQDYHNVYGIDVDLDSIAQISPDMYPLPLSATWDPVEEPKRHEFEILG